jgi:transcriptional regulator with XRE-family HTH domain
MIEIEERCALLIRELRKKKGLTLKECEELSQGRFKAVVMGSYERGTRAISLERLQEIADFYEVPIQYFFAADTSQPLDRKFTFDLRRMKNSSYTEEGFDRVKALLSHFIAMRGDWNGEILSIRHGDGEILTAVSSDKEIVAKLDFHGYLMRPIS